MENERGIFILTVLKKMLDKLVYQDNFEDLDDGMSDSNIGSRKDRNIKNRLFKIYGVINYVVNGTEDPIDLEIYDQIKVFDALWLEDCLSDLYDTLPKENRNEKISLCYTSNVENLGPALCSNSADTIRKKCRDRGELHYLYSYGG